MNERPLPVLSGLALALFSGAALATPVADGTATYVFTHTFSAPLGDGDVITVTTSELQPTSESTGPPDTIVHLIRLDDGDVVAFDDDGNTDTPCDPGCVDGSGAPAYPQCCLDSKLTHTVSGHGTYQVVVMSYWTGLGGAMDITVEAPIDPVVLVGHPFGGFHVEATLEVGDRVFVADRELDVEADVALIYVTAAREPTGAKAQQSDDDIELLPQIAIQFESSPVETARLAVGTYVPGEAADVRLFASKLGQTPSPPGTCNPPGGPDDPFVDCDQDGLTWELEAALGTCDSIYGPGPDEGDYLVFPMFGGDCGAVAAAVDAFWDDTVYGIPGTCASGAYPEECWSAGDTDNDGIADKMEVFGGKHACVGPPEPPYNLPSGCENTDLDPSACPGCPWSESLALSTYDWGREYDPTKYDVALFMMYMNPGVGLDHSVSAANRARLLFAFEGEGLECPYEETTDIDGKCPEHALNRYEVRLHLSQGDLGFGNDFRPYGRELVHAQWNAAISPMKSMGLVRLAISEHTSDEHFEGSYFPANGLAFGIPGRTMTVYNEIEHDRPLPSVETQPQPIAHEAGHTVGLCHGGPYSSHNFKLNYPSLMSYAYPAILPKSPVYDPGESCVTSGDFRFSRGLLPPLHDNHNGPGADPTIGCLPEASQPIELARLAACAGGWSVPSCDADSCDIEWSINGVIDCEEPPSFPIDLDQNAWHESPLLEDANDWLGLLFKGKFGIMSGGPEYAEPSFGVYHSPVLPLDPLATFQGVDDVSGWEHGVTTSGVSIASTGPRWRTLDDNPVAVLPEGAQGSIVVQSSPAMDALTGPVSTLWGPVRPLGYRIDVVASFDDFDPAKSAHQLLKTSTMDVWIEPEPTGGQGRVHYAYLTDVDPTWTSVSTDILVGEGEWLWFLVEYRADAYLQGTYHARAAWVEAKQWNETLSQFEYLGGDVEVVECDPECPLCPGTCPIMAIPFGDLVIGWSPAAPSREFRGRLDNLHLSTLYPLTSEPGWLCEPGPGGP